MSDLATLEALTQSPVQLPVGWYFDPAIHALEQKYLFDRGPGYVGHELMVPNQGDYLTLDWAGSAKALVRNATGAELLSNVCRHRQALILKGKGNARNIVCPMHRWTYGLDGKLLGAPHFPTNPCLDLAKTPLTSWNGLLFNGQRDVATDLGGLSFKQAFDFSGYVFDRATVTEYNFNWKTFMEVYLELYHVVPFHPGLGGFVNCDELVCEYGAHWSAQVVGMNSPLAKPGSAVYEKWQQAVRKYYGDESPPHGAIWLTYYPNVMLEWYPHTLVVSTIIPRGPEQCTNVVEFYYPEDIMYFERDYVEAEQQAYNETALEDEEICQRMNDGRKALYAQGLDEAGPYQSPMEDGMLHFHDWARRELEPHLAK